MLTTSPGRFGGTVRSKPYWFGAARPHGPPLGWGGSPASKDGRGPPLPPPLRCGGPGRLFANECR
jgi:hypothetical protein